MDLYFEDGVDDLAVPIDQEQLPEELPSSPDSWFPWGISTLHNSGFSNRHLTTYTNLSMEKVSSDEYRLSTEADMEMTETEGEHHSGLNIRHRGLNDDTISNGQSAYELDDLQGINSMDDIFLGSLLEEDARLIKNLRESCFSPEPLYVAGEDGNFWKDMVLDSDVVSSDSNAMGSSRYLMTHSFSPSLDWDKGAIETSNHGTCNSWSRDWSHVKAPAYEDMVISEHNGAHEQTSEETSLEEVVLHELKEVMAQMTQKTRLCFRDALYRLAHNSKQHNIIQSPNGEITIQKPSLEAYMLRREGTKTAESETNVIDRAVANLMFNRMEFSQGGKHVNMAPLQSEQESTLKTVPCSDCGKDIPRMDPYLLPTSYMHDAEVPKFSKGELLTTANHRASFKNVNTMS